MNRDLRLDSLRGLLLTVMVLDHLPGLTYHFFYQVLGFVTTAEGFVFLSGLVAGKVYGRILVEQGIVAMRRRVFQRGIQIYAAHLMVIAIMTLIYLSVGRMHCFSDVWMNNIPLLMEHTFIGCLLCSLMLYNPSLFEILPMFCLFLAVTPVILCQFVRNKKRIVLLTSFGLWAISQTYFFDQLSDPLVKIIPITFGYFKIFAWQFLFVAGLWIGYVSHGGKKSLLLEDRRLLALCSIMALSFFLVKHFDTSRQTLCGVDFGHFIDAPRLGPLRIVNFFAITYLVSYFIRTYGTLITWRWSCFLGQNSLSVFSFHVIVVYLVKVVQNQIASNSGLLVRMSVPLLAIATIFVIVKVINKYYPEPLIFGRG